MFQMTQSVTQRAYPRMPCEAPIRCGLINGDEKMDHLFDSRALNYSAGGLCYETSIELAPEAEVCIIMNDYQPGRSGPGCYRSYLTRTCWVQPLSNPHEERFAAGARIIAKSHEILNPGATRDNCDLCGALMSSGCMLECAESDALLCEHCFKHLSSVPRGKVRECLERFMMGNVV